MRWSDLTKNSLTNRANLKKEITLHYQIGAT